MSLSKVKDHVYGIGVLVALPLIYFGYWIATKTAPPDVVTHSFGAMMGAAGGMTAGRFAKHEKHKYGIGIATAILIGVAINVISRHCP